MRVVLADDSVLLREGIALVLADAGHEVVAAVGDGPSLVEAVLRERPDVALVDVRMPPSHTDEGLRAAVEVRRTWPAAPVLVLSQYVELSYADELLDSQPNSQQTGTGYLLKDRVSDLAEFLTAVESVAGGGTVLDPLVVRQLMGRRRDPLAGLTPRELEVLGLMAQGRSNAAVAAALDVTLGGVEKHTQRIFAKLGLTDDETTHRRVQAVVRYLRAV
ncbi:response regulator transcription factor [Kineococcus rhizosphaerae]|uniref:LuxR family two component transcriptional regulator n=1 Tax=Kineococcus rhizosphaerae TaxID=559628 RepID=A0A2T0R039_9ACTN|nr:response regulator transcription factor [Kineococcus rhizosphaerae]PRY12487.1 LuxR family two component transcriptional regulator [Kineococcus rhizosphaerae]